MKMPYEMAKFSKKLRHQNNQFCVRDTLEHNKSGLFNLS